MNIHQNARLTPKGRALLVRRVLGGENAQAAAAACGVSERTVRKWLARFRAEGQAGLVDRSSRPFAARAALLRPARPVSLLCADNVGPATALPLVSESLRPPSAAFCAAPASTASAISNPPARAPLRTPRTRRSVTSRYQEARPLPARRSSRHLRQIPPLPRRRLGIRARRHRRPLPCGFLPDPLR